MDCRFPRFITPPSMRTSSALIPTIVSTFRIVFSINMTAGCWRRSKCLTGGRFTFRADPQTIRTEIGWPSASSYSRMRRSAGFLQSCTACPELGASKRETGRRQRGGDFRGLTAISVSAFIAMFDAARQQPSVGPVSNPARVQTRNCAR